MRLPKDSHLICLLFLIIWWEYVAAANLGALPVTETSCVTQPFQSENCPNSHPIKILELHSSEGIQAKEWSSFLQYSTALGYLALSLNDAGFLVS